MEIRNVQSYSELDSLAVSNMAFEMLQSLDGQNAVAGVRANLRSSKQSDFSDDVLLSLYQNRVLIES